VTLTKRMKYLTWKRTFRGPRPTTGRTNIDRANPDTSIVSIPATNGTSTIKRIMTRTILPPRSYKDTRCDPPYDHASKVANQNMLQFNIFYPDLIDKSKAPTYKIIKEPGNDDTVLLYFTAGPPYEDIAFRIVNREWEYSHKRFVSCSLACGSSLKILQVASVAVLTVDVFLCGSTSVVRYVLPTYLRNFELICMSSVLSQISTTYLYSGSEFIFFVISRAPNTKASTRHAHHEGWHKINRPRVDQVTRR
jgi:hypothetical protein